MKIGLIDVDGTVPNYALMKISTFYKNIGAEVSFVKEGQSYDEIYACAILTKSKELCEKLKNKYGGKIEIGGTGYDIHKRLHCEIEKCKPDFDLYTADFLAPRIRGPFSKAAKLKKAEIMVNAGIGFTSRGCVNNCAFCMVPEKEGDFRQDREIKDLLNPRSNVLVLHDNNFTADPFCLDKLQEIRERDLVVDINQGVDIRRMTDEIAYALSRVKHLRSIH